MRASAGGPSDDLHHDGLLGSTEGLHRLLMAGPGQLLPVHLRAGTHPDLTKVIRIYLSCLLLLTVALVTLYDAELFGQKLSGALLRPELRSDVLNSSRQQLIREKCLWM